MYDPHDEGGHELDAKFSIETVGSGFDLIIESQGGASGGRPPRNSDYPKALVMHLRRMADLGMLLEDLQVASSNAVQLPEIDRQIRPEGYQLPLELGAVADFEELRLAIGRVCAAFGRHGKAGGNPTKRLRFRIRWPDSSGMSADSIANLLAHPVRLEKPTADPEELAERIERARKRIGKGQATPPRGRDRPPRSCTQTGRFVRDPEVVAWVLENAAGRCEHCRNPAPFKGKDGLPFLEVHHVRSLAEGGPDTIKNAVACCPNCHRQLHHDPARESLRLTLISSITRLNDFPRRA